MTRAVPAAAVRAIAWHTRSVDETARALQVQWGRGLSEAEAARRLQTHGPNSLAPPRPRSVVAVIARQFKSVIVLLLVAAGVVALLMGDVAEAVAIGVVIVLNALIGFVTEWRAGSALAGLRDQAVAVARVVRDGAERQVPSAELAPGDVVHIDAGDRVPADGRLVEHAELRVDEAALTGESEPVEKTTAVVNDADAAIADRQNMLHLGTVVTGGRATLLITTTGAETEMGRVGVLLDSVVDTGTPLEARLAWLGRWLLCLVLVLCVVIVIAGWLRGNALLGMVEVGISLAIAAIPEGLLAVTTMTLAIGMQRMAKMNALVRRLPAVEALGSSTVICTDKTGTLTLNEMTVQAFVVAGDRRVDVTGVGLTAEGTFVVDGVALPDDARALDRPLEVALQIGALCNDARIDRSAPTVTALGDPTEAALLVALEKAGLDGAALREAYPRIGEVPFRSETRRMVTVHTTPDGATVAYMKGSPAAVLAASTHILLDGGVTPMTDAWRGVVEARNDALAGQALRVLAVGHRLLPSGYGDDDLLRELIFVGLVGMLDPLREGARETIATCRRAGIRTVMITGDQEGTAAEIARQLGLDVDDDGKPRQVVHARALKDIDDQGLAAVVQKATVFARVSPTHKLKIVEALQRQGHVVAMTGDGVNDAPALRQADIGIAMGIRGTDVAKESADMVIVDDNFATIVAAVEQGRIVVNNILRFIHYLLSCNLAEIMTVFVAIMVGWPLPLTVLQILWLNLVTDIFPATALAIEPSAPDVMRQPPREPGAPLLTRASCWRMTWQAMVLTAATLMGFAVALRWYGGDVDGQAHAGTVAFSTLGLAQTFHVFNARSHVRSAFSRLFSNGWLWGAVVLCVVLQVVAVTVPFLRELLGATPLSWRDVGLIAAASLMPVVVVEAVKGAGALGRLGREGARQRRSAAIARAAG